LIADSGLFLSLPAALALAGPAALLAAMTLLRDVPAEWGRDALTAWTCVVAMLVAGASAGALGGAVLGILVLAAFAALAVAGPWGLTIAAGVAAAQVAAQLLAASWPAHPALAPAIALAAALGAVRAHMLR